MRHVCKHSIWRIWVRIKYNQVAPSKKINKMAFKEGKKWKGKDKKTTTIAHQCKDPNDHCNHCNIDGHTEDKCWKLRLELNPKNHKKDAKKKNMLVVDSRNQVENNYDVDEKIILMAI
jgi:hypothetical protein